MPSCFRTSVKRLETFTRMTRVYPNASFTGVSTGSSLSSYQYRSPIPLRRRFSPVDNYMDGHKGEILLMDATGNALLTIRRKKMSLGDIWLVYEGETFVNPRLRVSKSINILNKTFLAYVIPGNTTTDNRSSNIVYEIEGSYSQRSCSVYDDSRISSGDKEKEAVKELPTEPTSSVLLFSLNTHLSLTCLM
ncbi:hypothetical protein F3Y22_tig00110819pilonHSYRG00187 [Hibiscus syriacus]|uniref:Uncharacterized protein n=1 Tax=Hibiscus syriacus TaxID=106335 RepID=A0A6A2ZNJ2_HIBSY|nr:hypothetical protein F3Y22_tig00110819pilonHSYRG00187 [Hibiscus syriacus]